MHLVCVDNQFKFYSIFQFRKMLADIKHGTLRAIMDPLPRFHSNYFDNHLSKAFNTRKSLELECIKHG